MSQAAVVSKVALKNDWSIDCADVAQYEGIKKLLQILGYTFEQYDRYSADYSTICSSDHTLGGVTQAHGEEEHHFTNILDFLVFHYEAEGEAGVLLHEAILAQRIELAQMDVLLTQLVA